MTVRWQLGRTRRFGLAAVAAGIGLILQVGPGAARDEKLRAYGKHLAQECTGCHRLDGVDNGIPPIVGWQAEVFIATVRFYQAGKRTNPVMVSVATSLNEKQVEALATYFGSLPKPPPKAAPGKRPSR
jgi:cytochrome c553